MTATLSGVVDALQRANCKPTRTGNSYVAFCPVHEADGHGHKPSLTLSLGDKQPVVITCHAGCTYPDILKALGIEPKATSKASASRAGKRIVATYSYQDATGATLFEKVRYEPKDFRIRHLDATGAEVWRLPRVEPPLYRLPAVAAAIADGTPVYVVEGEKDADRLAAAGLTATTSYEGAAKSTQKPKWRDSYTAALAGADVVLLPDNDEPGKAHMRHVAAALADKALVRWLELPGLAAKGDVSDWLNAGHSVDELKALAANATAPGSGSAGAGTTTATNGGNDDDTEIARLAALTLLEYDRQRCTAAKALGIRGETLDRLVRAARGEPYNGNSGCGSVLEFPDVEPWPERVDGAVLLNELTASVRRFLSLQEHAAPALALWAIYSYIVVCHGHIAPTLAVTSPEKRCGKSTLLGWLYRLVDKPLLASNITAAAIFRTVDAYHPTLLIDEADSFLGETGDELRGILNSGHTKDAAFVIRNVTVGDNIEPRSFSTWGAKVVALIGKLEGRYSTLADRSIEIQLRRKMPSEKLMKLRHADENHFEELARRCARFAADNGARLGSARPDIPNCMNDRAADNWEPLFTIADLAGGNWPRLARTVALALSGGVDTSGGDGLGAQLLADLRRHFDSSNATSYPTTALLQFLNEIDDAPWPAFAKGKPMTARHLSRLLHPYGIFPHPIRLGATVAKGYEVSDFADAFTRYLPSNGYTVTSQSNRDLTPDSLSVTQPACNRYENASLASEQAGCNRVTDKTEGTAAAGGGAADIADDNPDDWF